MRNEQGEWVTVGGTGMAARAVIRENNMTAADGSPYPEWDDGSGQLGGNRFRFSL